MSDELNFTEQDLFAELADQFCVETMKPGDLTLGMVASHFEVSLNTAIARMNKLVAGGTWTRFKGRANDRRCWIYRKVVGSGIE